MDLRRPSTAVRIDAELVRALLEEQYPHLANESLAWVDEGWDNVTYRVGPAHAVRMPRHEAAVPLLLAEQRWLPVVAGGLPVGVPVPVHLGAPSQLFRWPWSVVDWIPGETADVCPLAYDQAESVAHVLSVLHQPGSDEAPLNPFRGVPLEARRDVVEERLERLGLTDLQPAWRSAVEAPPSEERIWIHGDLHPGNVLVDNGALAGLIDWGDMTTGDVATDLACAWMLFESACTRTEFFAAYDPSKALRARAAGWAVNFASAHLDGDDPRHTEIGNQVRQRIVEDWSS